MIDIIPGTLYSCTGCGYKTLDSHLAIKHSKTLKCKNSDMLKRRTEFVLKSDYDAMPSVKYDQNAETINNTTNNDNSTTNITVNLVVPETSVIASIQDAIESEECIREIRGASLSEIPAILFRFSRGKGQEKPLIKYDPQKDMVESKDPVTGADVKKSLKKYRNEYLAEQSDIYDDTYHIPYLPQPVKRDMLSMTDPKQFKTGNKKEKSISPAEVIKICSTGDHRMYKLPHETKRFYTDVAKNVDTEIKQCT